MRNGKRKHFAKETEVMNERLGHIGKKGKKAMSGKHGTIWLVVIMALVVGSSSAMAANKTWDGGGGDDNWTTAANWDAAVIAGDNLIFDGTTRLAPNNDFTSGASFGAITFNDTAGAFTLGGNGITVSGITDNDTTDTQTIDLDLTLTALRNFIVAAGGTLVVNGDVSGAGGILKSASGAGHLILAGNLSLTGAEALRLDAGTGSGMVTLSGDNSAMTGGVQLRVHANTILNLASPTALGQGTFRIGITSGDANFDNTSGAPLTLTTNNPISWQGTMHFLGTDDLHLGNGAVTPLVTSVITKVDQNTLTIGGVISNKTDGAAVSLTKQGAGTLVLSGTNTYTGATTVSAGTLLINGDQSAATGNIAVNSTGTLGGTGAIGGATTVNSGGTLSPGDSAGTLTINNNLTLKNGATAIFEGGDLVDVNGILDLDNDWTLKLTSGFRDGGSMVLFTYDTLAASPDLAPTFDISELGFTPTGALTLTDTGSSIVLDGISLVPEPATLSLLALGGIGVLIRRRR
ncbi:MAG TPA: hypothetical protein DCX07_07205 [Phycisphaerales bacterium]|nr:hypothetical protein [Phycisphaerales bacterium]